MKKFKNIIIGFGEGGQHLALDFGRRGEEMKTRPIIIEEVSNLKTN